MDATILYALGSALIIVGIVVVILAVILISFRGSKKGNMKAAGIIMIGPIPIIFGTDKKSVKTVLALAITLMIIAIILYYLWWK
jgi:uncharacterized protein (TIGR00304 family)